MSAEYSHSHRDYSYKSSRNPDYRFNKHQNSKESTTYAPRRTYYEDERDYNNSYRSHDNYDNNRYGYQGYKPRKYQKDTRTCNHGFHLWKTEFLVKNKDQPEVEKGPESKKEEVVSKVNNEGASECESLSGKSTNYVTEDSRKSLDTLGDAMPSNTRGTIDEILEEDELREKVKESNQENDNRVVSQETDESDEEKFSNIDLKVEKKLLENESDSDDVFGEDKHEEEERPIWEDVDTKQILEDIKKGTDFLSLYPQDILILNLTENEYKPQETAEEDQDEEEEAEVEDLNTIFALRVLERGFSRPSLEIKNNTGAFVNNDQESAKTDNGLLPIILESPNSIYNGSQSAFLPAQYTPMNRAIFKKLIPPQDYDAAQWHYTGNDGFMQGPFSSRQMDEWYIMGYLPLDLEINLKESKGLRRLRELVDIINREGDFLFNNMKEIINWFDPEEEELPPGIPISPRKLAAAQRKKRMEPQTAGLFQQEKRVLNNKECVSASLMGPKRLAAFNVYNQEELDNGVESHCKLSRNDSPLNSGVINHSYHNSPVNNNCPSVLPFPGNEPGSRNGNRQQEDFASYAWKAFVNCKN